MIINKCIKDEIMEIKDFIDKVAEQFDDVDNDVFEANTKFRKLDEWDSLTSLLIISMIDEQYEVVVSGDDIVKSETIQDLFNIVSSKTGR